MKPTQNIDTDDRNFDRWIAANTIVGTLFAAAVLAMAIQGFMRPAVMVDEVSAAAKREASLAPYRVMAAAALDELLARQSR